MNTTELNAWLREERRNYAHVINTAQMKPE
jgi:hypothetical protein